MTDDTGAYQGTPPPNNKWPPVHKGQKYVMDSEGVVWLLVPELDGGMATTATHAGPWSVGTNTLRKERGPLYILIPTENYDFRDYCPTIMGDELPQDRVLAAEGKGEWYSDH